MVHLSNLVVLSTFAASVYAVRDFHLNWCATQCRTGTNPDTFNSTEQWFAVRSGDFTCKGLIEIPAAVGRDIQRGDRFNVCGKRFAFDAAANGLDNVTVKEDSDKGNTTSCTLNRGGGVQCYPEDLPSHKDLPNHKDLPSQGDLPSHCKRACTEYYLCSTTFDCPAETAHKS